MTNNSTCSIREFIAVDNTTCIIIASIIVFVGGYLALEYIFKKHKIKEATTLSCIGSLVLFLTLAMLYYAFQKDSGMVTAIVTMILVIITGYYAWNTRLQVESMGDQARLIRDQLGEMRKQNDTREKQFTLMDKNIKYDRITKEMDLLILPLMTIYQREKSRGTSGKWWNWYSNIKTSTDPISEAKFRDAIDNVEQNRYLATKTMYPLIDKFILRLRDMKRSEDAEFQKLLQEATTDLYYKTKAGRELLVDGGFVGERYYELAAELQALDNIEGKSLSSRR